MKKKYGVEHAVPPLLRSELEQMKTKDLLVHLQRLRMCEECPQFSDMEPADFASVDGILFKDTPEWQQAYHDVKETLANREHVPSGKKRQIARQKRSQRNRTSEHRNGR